MVENDDLTGQAPGPLDWMFDGDGRKFAADYYLKRPFAKAGFSAAIRHLANMSVVGELLDRSGADVIVGHLGKLRDDTVRSIADAQAAMSAGFTIGIRHAQKIHTGLNRLAGQFKEALGGDVDVHVYCTPGGRAGFGWHYDPEEVFVLQTVGSKTWKLRKNTVNPWPLMENIPRDQRYEREISPMLSCRLEAGDWLYIPSGYWHTTEAHTESISLSVGIRPETAIDVLDAIRKRLTGSMLWRQRLPMNGSLGALSPNERVAELEELCRELAKDLTEHLNPAFLAEHAGRASQR